MRLKLKCFWIFAKYLSLNIEKISPNEHSVFLLAPIIAFHSISISKINSSSLFTHCLRKDIKKAATLYVTA